ncbi:hypothetical protein [Actibacterium sp. XHP0104]|uniref:hypothetical protein n=1 Tax=Actibacterium sp. XHP0104 TaxID=2984335 RepID=UPI0021E894F3|nr:hypothetical protein [Actibacterium sp. XHP0104]MCV2881226.1 hypothetical protein [Actibacterium sp. XHP0104]
MSADINLSVLPLVRLKGSNKGYGSISELGKAAARANPMLLFANRFAEVSDKLFMSPAHCLVYLSRRVADTEAAAKRSGWIGGRIYNSLTGADVNYVGLSGAVLGGTLRYIGEDVPEALDYGCDYLLRRDRARDYLDEFTARARERGMIK